MKDIEIVGVTVHNKDVIISLLGGSHNVVGTLHLWEKDDIKRHDLRRRAEALMNGNVLVDLALSITMGRWRLIGKNREIIGGLEPTQLNINQSLPPKKEDKGGLGWPEAWGGDV